jgi:hypothetical protein
MSIIRKGAKVIKVIKDSKEHSLNIEGYVMLDDSWVDEYVKVLYKEGVIYNILWFQEILVHELIITPSTPYMNCWGYRKVSCVKLDKDVKVGDIFYTKLC